METSERPQERAGVRGNDDDDRLDPERVAEAGLLTFEDFYRTEYRPLLSLAWSLTGRRDLGEELVQEAMVTTHQRWSTVSAYESPGGWTRRVLLNAATSHARRRATERRALARTAAVRTSPEPPGLPDEAFWAALRALPQRQAQAMALHYVEDRSVADIATVLDIAENTVKVHLHRGRTAMARALRATEDER